MSGMCKRVAGIALFALRALVVVHDARAQYQQQYPRPYFLGVYGEVVNIAEQAPALAAPPPVGSRAGEVTGTPPPVGSMADDAGITDDESGSFSDRTVRPRPGPTQPPIESMADDAGITDDDSGSFSGRTVRPRPTPPPGGYVPLPTPAPIYGVKITQVVPGSPAARYGYEPGDIIKYANGYRIENMDQLRWVIANSGGVVRLTVINVRDGRDLTTEVRLY